MIRVKVARCDCCDCEWPIEDYRGDHPWRQWGARCDCGWRDLDLDTQPDALHEADRHLDDAHKAGPKFRRWLCDLLDEAIRAQESRADMPTSTDTPDVRTSLLSRSGEAGSGTSTPTASDRINEWMNR